VQGESEYGAMIKKKAARARKTAAKKTDGKKTTKKKQKDPAQVREEIAGIVKSGAKGITKAVMDQAMHGELAPAKYLFEMAGVYPAVNDGEHATEEEDCLAKTLLDRLNLPRKAAEKEDDEEAADAGIDAKASDNGETGKGACEDEVKA
jgi:hypothetical protein